MLRLRTSLAQSIFFSLTSGHTILLSLVQHLSYLVLFGLSYATTNKAGGQAGSDEGEWGASDTQSLHFKLKQGLRKFR